MRSGVLVVVVSVLLALTPSFALAQSELPVMSISDSSVLEGDAGTRPMIFTVSLSFASSDPVTVGYAIVLSFSTAKAPGDYEALPSGSTLTIPAGQTSATITITVKGDRLEEGNEIIFLRLSSPVNAILPAQNEDAIGTILDDDGMRINDVSITEGDSGQKNAVFTVSRNTDTAGTVTVDYATADNTATADSDYVATSGKLTFTFGTPSQTISVPIIGDQTVEPDETFFVNLSNPVNILLADGQGIGTIVNDDLDADGDGIVDSNDNCPNMANTSQDDFDMDGIGDVCDTTPFGVTDLSVTKTGPTSAFSGGTIHYDISIQNLGPNAAINAIIKDTIPTEIVGLSLVNASPQCGGLVDGKVICNVPQIDSFFDIFIELQIPPNTSGQLTNTVSVTADNDAQNDEASAVTQVLIPDTDGDGVLDDVDSNPNAFTAVNSGDWDDPNVWEGGIVPGDIDDKEILSGVTVTITSSINNSGATIDNFGTLINSGTITNHFVDTSARINNFGTFENSGSINNASSFIINSGLFINAGNLVTTGNITTEIGSTFNNALGGTLTNHALIDSSGHINNFGTLDNQGNINNRDSLDNYCAATLINTLNINFNPINEVLCIPNLISPTDGSTVTEPKPDLIWDANGETRLVTYSASLDDTSNPEIPIELVSLSLVSAEPLNDLTDGNYEWFVTTTIDPSYSPGYTFTSTPIDSTTFSFDILLPPTGDLFCDGMMIDQLIASSAYNVIDNRDGHLGKNIKGTKGNDLILASDVGNKISAKDGNDCIIGGSGKDNIFGGKGDDQIFGMGGNDRIHGQQGNNVIRGGDGNDVIWGGQGNDVIDAGNGNDRVHANQGDDVVIGGDGNDWLGAGIGNDVVSGGPGNDKIFGRPGNDTLNGDEGNDRIHGGQGNDTLNGGDGSDVCHGGQGNNTFDGCESKKPMPDEEDWPEESDE